MTNLSTIIIILTSCLSQSLAQIAISQQQLLVRTSDFMFSAEQIPITINYLVEIQEFSPNQIDQLKNAIVSITSTNRYELAVTDIDGKQEDMFLKSIHLKLLHFTKYFTDTLQAFNSYLDSHRDIKSDFKYGTFACNISQDFSRKNIPNYLLNEMSEHQENAVKVNDSDIIDRDSKQHKKLKSSINNILEKLHSVSEDYDDLFE